MIRHNSDALDMLKLAEQDLYEDAIEPALELLEIYGGADRACELVRAVASVINGDASQRNVQP